MPPFKTGKYKIPLITKSKVIAAPFSRRYYIISQSRKRPRTAKPQYGAGRGRRRRRPERNWGNKTMRYQKYFYSCTSILINPKEILVEYTKEILVLYLTCRQKSVYNIKGKTF